MTGHLRQVYGSPFALGLLLVAALALPAIPVAPAAAQNIQLDALLDASLAHEEEHEEEEGGIAGLRDRLQQVFSSASPYLSAPGLFTEIAAAPFAFSGKLQQLHQSLVMPVDEPFDTLLAVLRANLPGSLERQACVVDPVPLPDSLEEAAQQVQRSAAQSVAAFNDSIPRRGLRDIERYHHGVFELLARNPFGGDLSRSERRMLRRYMEALLAIGHEASRCDGLRWASLISDEWLDRIGELLAAHPRAEEEIVLSLDTPQGLIWFGGREDSELLTSELLLAVDLGGDDIYGVENGDIFNGRPQIIIDLAGNDRYESATAGGYAAGLGRTAMLIDRAGDDDYDTATLSQGAAVLGVAILSDRSGNDSYTAAGFAQGFALFGVGLLIDGAGNDSYRIDALGQGLGMTRGLGLLRDDAGDDRYVAKGSIATNYGTPGLTDAWAQGVGLGQRNRYPGGIGILSDAGGADSYDAGSLAQGGGYFFGIGLLVDAGDQDDRYLGARYNFGWGAHGGLGYFSERGGNDSYRSRQIVAAGLAWDQSLAYFEDLSGDDSYLLGDFSLGAAAHQSAAIFFDGGGADRYAGTRPARADEGTPNYSLFIDAGPEPNRFDPVRRTGACTRQDRISYIVVTPDLDALDVSRCQSSPDN